MLSAFQKTIAKTISFQGIGLHTGLKSNISLVPQKGNRGIVFKRIDLKENNIVEASYKNVSSAKLCTTLKNKFGVSISTVEHLLAALYITGVDNILIEIDKEEVPIMDGSSKEFVDEINKAGIKSLTEKRKYLKIIKKIELKENEKYISIEPNHESLEVDFELGYSNDLIGSQRNKKNFSSDDLVDVYASRTFCLYEDIENIKKIGLAKGGSLDNAVVVKGKEVLNEGGLRNGKEFVNHKILDLVGDFLLSGYRILGNVKCIQGGHSLSNIFLKSIFSDSANFIEFEINNKNLDKRVFKIVENKLAVNA